jgi:hypothetical protein
MTPELDNSGWRILRQVADRETTRSLKRTINAAILLRAVQVPRASPGTPRKAPRMVAFLGVVQLLVSYHEQLLRMLAHHIPL